jgi:putative ABC transport system permease protein
LGSDVPALTGFPPYAVIVLFLFAIIVGLIAGIYPAMVLSSLKSVDSLKGKLKTTGENILLRKSLAGFQFCTATIAFTGSIIISQQINFFFSKDIGYSKDYIVAAQVPRNWSRKGVENMKEIRNQFAALPQVSHVSLSFEIPDGENGNFYQVYKRGADSTSAISSPTLVTDELYAATYNIPMAAGIFFNAPGVPDNVPQIVINETEARALGWNNAYEALGQQVGIQGMSSSFTIAGVTKDFHFGSMQNRIQPLTFLNVNFGGVFRYLSFKINPGNVGNSIAALQKKWSELLPGVPFEYNFMDDTLKKLYQTEIRLKKASHTATVLALIIVLLGIAGLVSLSIQKRTKEIGIRKVLGSSVAGIISLFMKEFLLVILIAGVVACPVGYMIMRKWLQAYEYRIDITAQPFLLAVLVPGFITALLICVQTIKAALSNPVKSLRTEW